MLRGRLMHRSSKISSSVEPSLSCSRLQSWRTASPSAVAPRCTNSTSFLPRVTSEDIDLVQVRPEPVGKTLDRTRAVLDPWLGAPRRQFKEGRVNLVHRFESEDVPPLKMRLKIEVNTREHFTQLGRARVPFEVNSPWFRGTADVHTFALDELLGTKLRALYQRKKGRDLFDLSHALETGRGNVFPLWARVNLPRRPALRARRRRAEHYHRPRAYQAYKVRHASDGRERAPVGSDHRAINKKRPTGGRALVP